MLLRKNVAKITYFKVLIHSCNIRWTNLQLYLFCYLSHHYVNANIVLLNFTMYTKKKKKPGIIQNNWFYHSFIQQQQIKTFSCVYHNYKNKQNTHKQKALQTKQQQQQQKNKQIITNQKKSKTQKTHCDSYIKRMKNKRKKKWSELANLISNCHISLSTIYYLPCIFHTPKHNNYTMFFLCLFIHIHLSMTSFCSTKQSVQTHFWYLWNRII